MKPKNIIEDYLEHAFGADIESVPECVREVCQEVDAVVKNINDDKAAGLRSTQVIALIVTLWQRGVIK